MDNRETDKAGKIAPTTGSPHDGPLPPSGVSGTPSGERKAPREIGGPKGPEPTRYGDWEVNGRCSDF
jgi:hypothetical protein